MTSHLNTDAYRFLVEALVYPEERDAPALAAAAERAGRNSPALRDAIGAMMASPELGDCDVYLHTFEIGARCPLYLGHYLFEEPTNCRGAALSGRNGYMIQLKNLYRHFGFELQAGELPDYLPLMLDFLAMSAGHPAHKYRRWLVKQFMQPALATLGGALREADNVYAPIAGILEHLFQVELGESPAGAPPAPSSAHGLGAGEPSRFDSEAVTAPSPSAPRPAGDGLENTDPAPELQHASPIT